MDKANMLSIAEIDAILQVEDSSLDIFNEDMFNGMPALVFENDYFILALYPYNDQVMLGFEDYNSNFIANINLLEEDFIIDLPQELSSSLNYISKFSAKETSFQIKNIFLKPLISLGFHPNESFEFES